MGSTNAGKPTVLLCALVLAAWLQPGTCTSSLGGMSGYSWEGARKAAKETFRHNLERAGLIRHAVAEHQPALSSAAGVNATVPAHVSASPQGGVVSPSEVHESDQGSAFKACTESVAIGGFQQCSNPETAAADAGRKELTSTEADAHAVQHNIVQSEIENPVTGREATVSEQPAQQRWEYGPLISNIVCFLLGWFVKGLFGAPPQHRPAQDNKSVQTAVSSPSTAESNSVRDNIAAEPANSAVVLKQLDDAAQKQLRISNGRRDAVEATHHQQQQHCAGAPAGESMDEAEAISSTHDSVESKQQRTKGNAAGIPLSYGECEAASAVMCESATAGDEAAPSAQQSTDAVSSNAAPAAERSMQGCEQGQELEDMSRTSRADITSPIEQLHLQDRPGLQTSSIAEGLLLQIQNQLVQQPEQQAPQVIHLSLTADSAAVNAVVIPSIRIVQQLATGVHTLSTIATSIVHHAQQLSTGLSSLNSRLDSVLSWARQRDHQARLASQQGLGERSSRLGLALLLMMVGVTAVRVGRVWDVHQECRYRGQQSGKSWGQRLTGTHHMTTAWQYVTCCAQELGLFAVGLVLLYWLARGVWTGLLINMFRSHPEEPSRNWQLDVLVFKGVVCSVVGAHVIHCLGAAWLPWLLLWWCWCWVQIVLQVKPLHGFATIVLVVAVSLVLPVLMAVLPFHAQGILVQNWLLEAVPVLRQLPNFRNLIPVH